MATRHASGGAVGLLRHWWDRILGEMAKFGVIGIIGVFVDMGAYTLLRFGPPGPTEGFLYGHAKIATLTATAIATLFSWVCNRYWTFRDKRTDDKTREIVLFAGFNIIGALITLACVVVTIDVLHLGGLTWETIGRGIGIGLGTIFRFWAYRTFVFVSPPGTDDRPGPDDRYATARG